MHILSAANRNWTESLQPHIKNPIQFYRHTARGPLYLLGFGDSNTRDGAIQEILENAEDGAIALGNVILCIFFKIFHKRN